MREQAGNIVHAQQNIFKAHTKQVRPCYCPLISGKWQVCMATGVLA